MTPQDDAEASTSHSEPPLEHVNISILSILGWFHRLAVDLTAEDF